MTDIAVIALPYFADTAKKVADAVFGTYLPYHEEVFRDAMAAYSRIIAIMATGIVVRKIAPLLTDKWQDPAIVVISPDLMYAIPISGGHHGANQLARDLNRAVGTIPVITTATEATGKEAVEVYADKKGLRILNTESTRRANAAVLTGTAGVYRICDPGMVIAGSGVSFLVADGIYAIGVGCRRGVSASEVQTVIMQACADAAIIQKDVFIYASTRLKAGETGLIDGIRACNGTLIFLDDAAINAPMIKTKSAAGRLGLQGVAEPAALAVSHNKELIMEKKIYGNVTIAIAR